MRRMTVVRLIFVVAAVLLAGCATSEMGRKFDTAAADKIEIGKTTEAEVLSWLGSPLQQTVRSDGTKVYVYLYRKTQAYMTSPVTMKAEGQGDKIGIKFNPQGVVTQVVRGSTPGSINR
jgi:outer membrane protein assembly factor BamE (lipoprotein component of BamABCDE complex)